MSQAEMEAGVMIPVNGWSLLLFGLALIAVAVVDWWWDTRGRRWLRVWWQHRKDAHRLWVKGAAERDRKHAAYLAGRCGR